MMQKVHILINLLVLVKLSVGIFISSLKDGEIFDFIVVGGGTAGCVVASRLAESGRHTVLLIEEGGIPNPKLEVPALSGVFAIPSFTDEIKVYPSVPQANVALEQNGIVPYLIGKTIGGGSSVNGMFWNRGNPQDYNNWVRLTRDQSWSYENLLPYFTKSENYTGFHPTNQRGINGPITISNPSFHPGLKEIIHAAHEIGYPFGDPNGPQTPSIALIDFSQKQGRRVSSYKGYIKPLLTSGARRRDNLKILLNTEAKRVIFDGNRALGVTYAATDSAVMGYAKARKEIIVCAGVMDSPALLMRSGIGPEDVLRNANIPLIKQLPVGRNLHDHTFFTMPVIYSNRSVVIVPSLDLTPETWKLYEEKGQGPYSSYTGCWVQGFFQSTLEKSSFFNSNWPDFHFIPCHWSSETNSVEVQDLQETEVAITWAILFTRPKSRGTVTLNPQNVDGPPLIDAQYLTHPDDMRVMLDAIQTALKMCEGTSAMKSLGCRFPSISLPSCSHLPFRSESYWTCYIKQRTLSGLHGAGTCRMGSGPEDPGAVVDSQLKVIGVEGLSVADASVMGMVTNANTQAPVYVIAEKASDLILKRWREVGNAVLAGNYFTV